MLFDIFHILFESSFLVLFVFSLGCFRTRASQVLSRLKVEGSLKRNSKEIRPTHIVNVVFLRETNLSLKFCQSYELIVCFYGVLNFPKRYCESLWDEQLQFGPGIEHWPPVRGRRQNHLQTSNINSL